MIPHFKSASAHDAFISIAAHEWTKRKDIDIDYGVLTTWMEAGYIERRAAKPDGVNRGRMFEFRRLVDAGPAPLQNHPAHPDASYDDWRHRTMSASAAQLADWTAACAATASLAAMVQGQGRK